MNFFNSLSQIAKNQKNFKRWEKEQRDNEAQRQELYKRRNHTPEEISHAKDVGETIIDVVDIMDNHSENIAENIETAVQPLVGVIPFAALLASGILTVKKIIQPAEKAVRKIKKEIYNNNPKAQDLCQRISEYHINHYKEHNLTSALEFRTRNLSNKNTHKFILNPEHRKEAEELLNIYKNKIAPHMKKVKWLSWAIPLGSFLAAYAASNIYAAKLQIDGSKIARFQAREVLKDPKTFVDYTPEQVEQAKAELAKHPERIAAKKKEKLKSGMIKGIRSILKDRKAYKKAKTLDTDKSQKVTRELSLEELKQAKRDKEVIQRVVRKINNEAEKYAENMEVAGNVIIGGTPFLGAAVGLVISAICNAAKVFDKAVDKAVKNLGSDKAQKSYQEYKKFKPKQPGRNAAWRNFFADMTEKELSETAKHAAKESFTTPAKKILTAIMATKAGRNTVLGIAGGFISGITGALIGLKLQKSAARTGRYTAKQELLKDPRNFIGYSDEDFEEVKDIKYTEKPKSKLKEYLTFIPNVIRQYYKYEKYKKTEYKEHQALRDELQKLEVSDEQIKNAKNLQRKVFNTFEKVDDNSQIYSESMEAATEMAQPFVYYGFILALLSPAIVFGIQAFRGKYSSKNLIDKITKYISKGTDVMKKKWFKNYLNDVDKKLVDNIKSIKTKKLNIDKNQKSYIAIDTYLNTYKDNPLDFLAVIKQQLHDITNTVSASSPEMIKTTLKSITYNHYNNRFINSLHLDTMDKDYLVKILPRIEKIINDIPEAELKKIAATLKKEYEENPEKLIAFIQSGDFKSILMTSKVKKALTAAGITWGAFSLVMLWGIETIMADLQLKAGRLGVMKALESLQDPTYYANIEPTETAFIQAAAEQSAVENDIKSDNLLAKFKKNAA